MNRLEAWQWANHVMQGYIPTPGLKRGNLLPVIAMGSHQGRVLNFYICSTPLWGEKTNIAVCSSKLSIVLVAQSGCNCIDVSVSECV